MKASWPLNLAYAVFDTLREIDKTMPSDLPEDIELSVEYAMNRLSLSDPRGAEILRLKFQDGYPLRSIGEKVGLSSERVRQIEKSKIRLLCKPPYRRFFEIGVSQAIHELECDNANLKKYNRELESEREAAWSAQKADFIATSQDLNISLWRMDLSVRAYNALRFAGYHTLRDLLAADLDYKKLRSIRNIGDGTAREILNRLEDYCHLVPSPGAPT